MIDRVGAAADQGIERGIVVEVDGIAVLRRVIADRRRFDDAVHQPHAPPQRGDIARIAEEVGVDRGRRRRIAAGQPHRPPAFRAQHAGVTRKAMAVDRGAAVVFQHGRHEMELDVGRRQIGRGAPEAARLGKRRGHHASAVDAVLDDGLQHLPRAGQAVTDEVGRLRFPARHIIDVVLQIRADRIAMHRHRNALFGQVPRRADARQHQDLRAAERPGRQDHPAARAQHFGPPANPHGHAGHAALLDHQPFDQHTRADRQIGARR